MLQHTRKKRHQSSNDVNIDQTLTSGRLAAHQRGAWFDKIFFLPGYKPNASVTPVDSLLLWLQSKLKIRVTSLVWSVERYEKFLDSVPVSFITVGKCHYFLYYYKY